MTSPQSQRQSQQWNRRNAIKLATLAAGSALFPIACRAGNAPPETASSPAAAPGPTAVTAASDGVSRVVLVKTADRVGGVRKALDLLQPDGIAGEAAFVKPNYNTGDPSPAATDTLLLETLIQELQQAGAQSVRLGDRSGMADTRRAMEQKGVFELADRYGIQALVFDELAEADWQRVAPDGTHWPQGFAVARPVLDSGAIVNTCCLKTHRYGGHFTLSLKNSVGMVAKYLPNDNHNYMADLHGSADQRRMIAEINQTYRPALVLLDGVEAFVNGGPASGKKVAAEVILAGTDRVAIDAVAVGILRELGTTPEVSEGSVWELEQIRRAAELGLGAGSDEQIELITADGESRAWADRARSHLA